jgi:hypothetical protein
VGWKQHLGVIGHASHVAGLSPSRKHRWTGTVQFTNAFASRIVKAVAQCLSQCRARIRNSINSDHGWYYQQPFAWMEEYNAALLEPDAMQAKQRIQAALRAVLQRKSALETNAMGSPEWNLLQYAELVLRHIGRVGAERILFSRDPARQQNEPGVFQEKKAA